MGREVLLLENGEEETRNLPSNADVGLGIVKVVDLSPALLVKEFAYSSFSMS